MSGGLVVELVGLPGSGKSRATRRLVDALRSLGLRAGPAGPDVGPHIPAPRRLARKTGLAVAAAAQRPGLTAATAAALGASRQAGRLAYTGCLLRWQVALARSLRAHATPGIHVLDEGLLQAVWSAGHAGDPTPLVRLVERRTDWPVPHVLGVIRIDPAVALDRLDRRASRHSRVQHLPAVLQHPSLVAGSRRLDLLAETWAGVTAGRCDVVELSAVSTGELDLEPLVQAVGWQLAAAQPVSGARS